MKLVTPLAINPEHYSNLLFAARTALPHMKAKDIANVGLSIEELECALQQGNMVDAVDPKPVNRE
jgi:hypothetical protein